MKIKKISLFAVCIFAHSFTQPASAFAGKFASACTKKNLATLATLAATQTAAQSLVEPGNPISDRFHEIITDITKCFLPKQKKMLPGETCITLFSQGEIIDKPINCHKPTSAERSYLKETLQHHPDNLNPQKINVILDRILIGENLLSITKNNKINGFHNTFTDEFIVDSKLLDPSNRSYLLANIMHENDHCEHFAGHHICNAYDLGLAAYALPAYFQIRKNCNPFTMLAACSMPLLKYGFDKMLGFTFINQEEARADTKAAEAIDCAGCAETIVSKDISIRFSKDPELQLKENRAKAHKILKIAGWNTGYVKAGILSDPNRRFSMQSCDLCLPQPRNLPCRKTATQPIKQAEPIELK